MKDYNIFFETSEDMTIVPDKSIKLMITSPPYWNLKDYGVKDQIGYQEDYETYLGRLYTVWKEVYRVLKKDGFAIININTKTNLKNLILIPYDIINQLKEIGFFFRDIHYWHKSSGIPRPDNLADHFEYFLIFSKEKNTHFNPLSFYDYKTPKKIDNINIWNLNKKFGSIGKKYMTHPAIFPLEYISRMIEIFTKEGDYVLDPFLGSGTTLLSTIKTKRKCVSFELNKREYFPLIINRLQEVQINPQQINFF